ncbi:hypothetical protein, partial [Reinekea sp.]
MNQQTTLIIGASSAIAKALAAQVIADPDAELVLVSRDVSYYQSAEFEHAKLVRVNDYQEAEI